MRRSCRDIQVRGIEWPIWYHLDTIGDMAMTLRLSDEEATSLRAYADAHGRSMQDVARTAIVEYVTERAHQRDALLKSIVAEDRVMLDLLAQ
jgi:hypothetical protein